MMAERAVVVSHTTITRWVIRYSPEFEKRWSRFSRSIGCSWRVDRLTSQSRVTGTIFTGSWPYGGFPVAARLRNRSGASVLSQGPCITHRSPAAEDHTGWPLAQSSGAALTSARTHCTVQSQSPQLKVSEQYRRTRSSSDQAKVRTHARLQVICQCCGHDYRDRACT